MSRHISGIKQFPQSSINEYIQEIFGFVDSDNAVHKGLVDSYTSEEFDVRLQALQFKWDSRELKCFASHKSHSPLFYMWFTKHIADICRNHTLRSLREDVGLGCPPMAFRTNNSESINAILKDCVGFKKQKWAVFNNIIKTAVNKQQQKKSLKKRLLVLDNTIFRNNLVFSRYQQINGSG